MAKKTIETYKGNITEFVDWVNGLDDITGRNKTNNLPVSGGTIRRLLQSHLKKPVFMVSDASAGLYRVFSSEAAYTAWLDDPETFADLELFNFVRPSDYEIKTNLDTGNRYLVSGMHDQNVTKLVYDWSVENDKGTYEDTVVATYTITTASGAVTKFSQNYDSSGKHVELDLYDYLDLGQTSIRIDLLANSTGASRNYTIYITQLVLNLESDFAYFRGHDRGATINFNWHLTRNNANTASSLYVILDGVQVDKQDIQLGSTSVSGIVQLLTDDLPASTIPPMNDTSNDGRVSHTLQLCVRTSYNLMSFDSNILYYTFEMNSTEAGIKNYFINNFFNFAAGTKIFPVSPEGLYLTATQYMPVELNWAYYTDMLASENTVQINWKLYENDTPTDLASIEASKGKAPDALSFIPATYSKETEFSPITSSIKLVGEYTSQDGILRKLCSIPMYIEKSTLNIVETSGYDFKLSAYGRSNSSKTKDVWTPELSVANNDDINISFHNIKWNDNSGWFENSFRTSGVDSWCEITYNPLKGTPANGRTIEVEFESEKINDPSDILITIGDPNSARIEIAANRASLFDSSGIERIHTNYKANERVKIAFIINSTKGTTDSELVYIVSDGILERGAEAKGYSFGAISNGKIIIGKSASGIKFYNLRTYLRDLTYSNMYNNFIYDSENKLKLINNNAVVDSQTQQIDYSLCCRKLDTILITGDLTDILKGETGKEASEIDVTIERFCPFDTTKNFKVEGCQIRKHGQSTLNYPITSMKFWLNKSTNSERLPKFTCEGQSHLGLGKNRYIMKDGAVPANKFILQANYADSSGVHNGSILRLINDSWYNANIDGQFKLRTEPQLFASNQTATLDDGTIMGKNAEGNNWDDVTRNPSSGISYTFPYQIRNAPDSFPCVVFYKNTSGTNTVTFLGQYVFMDDKKSDFCYGERSIYNADPKDPFCLKTENKDNDTDDYKVWDNDNVLRIEVLNINTFFTSYMNDHDENNVDFEARIPQSTGDIYRWEQDFEMIYPDPDDLAGKPEKGTDKWGVNSKFKRTAKPFVDWFRWLVGTYNDHTTFRAEAAQHLDLYKMAAYYITMLRCGLVDSGERNVQIKTYDGVHFHYEPWDMDIALGNKNTGGIAFDPPIDRNTKLSAVEWAISGRSADPDTGIMKTSNWLWDALEAWPHFMNDIIPTVAEALSKAGFNYNNLSNMFDNEYTAKWCEIIYNESGHYKYIDNGGSEHSYLDWLQGSRVNHRHWWLSTSMDYYDAKWTCGDFKSHFVYIAAGHTQTTAGTDIITVTPSNPTFLTLTQNDGEVATDIEVSQDGDSSGDSSEKMVVAKECSRSNPATFDISTLSFSNKVPTKILGATYIEDLDISCLAPRIDLLDIKGAYSSVNGASIKTINVGNKIIKDSNYNDNYHYIGDVNTTYNLRLQVSPQNDNLENLHTINIRGQLGKRGSNPSITANSLLRGGNEKTGRTQISNIYAMGANMSYFLSSKSGNSFDTLELPATNLDGTTDQYGNPNSVSIMTNIEMNNTSWNNISFWNGSLNTATNKMHYERYNIYGNYNYYVPTSINSITFTGSTANSANAKDFIFNWINGIKYEITNDPANQSLTQEEIDALVDEALGNKTLILQDINWSSATCGNNYSLSYDDLVLLSKLNHGVNNVGGTTYKGYVVLTSGNLGPVQLSRLKVLFGESAFERSGSGLIIDQERDYIEINLSGDAYINDDNLEFYLKEVPDNAKNKGQGGVALLSATRFQLQEVTDTDYNWFIKSVDGDEDPGSVYKSCSLSKGADGRTYLTASESNYGNYKVNVGVVIGTERRWLQVNIIGATYPDSYTIDHHKTGSYVYQVNNGFIFGGSSSSAEFYITPNKAFTANIYDVNWTLTRDSDNTVLINNESYKAYEAHDLSSQMLATADTFLTKAYNAGGTASNPLDSPYGMTLKAISSPNTLTMYYYTLTATIRFMSNYQLVTTKKVIIMDDSSIIMQAGSGVLYTLMNNIYTEVNGVGLPSQVYRYHLLDMGDTVDFSQEFVDDTTGNRVHISNLKTSYSNQSVLRYLINVKHVIFDELNLTNNWDAIQGADKNQMYFHNMTNLESVSLVNCSALEYDLDFSDNLKLKSLDMRGTSINAILPENTIIETLKLGTPTNVTLHGATHLSPENIIVEDSTEIDYIDIVNSGNNESFNIFGKVMNVDTNGVWVDPNAVEEEEEP